MTKILEFESNRLRLRQWCEQDYPVFAIMNTDAEVMEFYPDKLNATESNALAHKFKSLIASRGWGFWAVELIDTKEFIGFVGLNEPTYTLPVLHCVEIGWRVAKEHWGNGYATEAATAALGAAFDKLGMSDVYSFTPISNTKSQAVMERIGMIDTKQNFEHPLIPKTSSLRGHVLYKIDQHGWQKNRN